MYINYIDCGTAVAWTNKVNTNVFDACDIFRDDNVIMFFCLTTSHLDVDRDVCLLIEPRSSLQERELPFNIIFSSFLIDDVA